MAFMSSRGLYNLSLNHQEKCWRLLEKLFPIYRTILGFGFEKSLKIIKEVIPLSIIKFPSGTRCGSWIIPPEWQVQEAYISNLNNKKIIDFKTNNFHLWQYSVPFSGKINKQDLIKKHILISETAPKAIPLRVVYYNKTWGFSLKKEQLTKLSGRKFFVHIDTKFRQGEMCIGELFLRGRMPQEIIIDAVLSSPSLANNLSGVAVAVFLAKLIRQMPKRNFSYRILFTPETIGPIALHFLHKDFGKNVVGGYNLVNLGDKNHFNYKKSRKGDTITDRAMIHSLKFFGKNFRIENYDVLTGTCGNEKAYNSLGIEIPVGSFRRSPLGSYLEYDTSKDDLTFVSPNSIFESLQVVWGAIQALERSLRYKHKFEGEPFLTGYGLSAKIRLETERIPYDYLMAHTTGDLTLVDIADKAGLPVTRFDEAVFLLKDKGLITLLD